MLVTFADFLGSNHRFEQLIEFFQFLLLVSLLTGPLCIGLGSLIPQTQTHTHTDTHTNGRYLKMICNILTTQSDKQKPLTGGAMFFSLVLQSLRMWYFHSSHSLSLSLSLSLYIYIFFFCCCCCCCWVEAEKKYSSSEAERTTSDL